MEHEAVGSAGRASEKTRSEGGTNAPQRRSGGSDCCRLSSEQVPPHRPRNAWTARRAEVLSRKRRRTGRLTGVLPGVNRARQVDALSQRAPGVRGVSHPDRRSDDRRRDANGKHGITRDEHASRLPPMIFAVWRASPDVSNGVDAVEEIRVACGSSATDVRSAAEYRQFLRFLHTFSSAA